MDYVDHVCRFLEGAQLVRLPVPNKLEDAICGKPAEWKLVINGMDPIWVCHEHYDVLIAQGWSEA
jgi:hypothetical protein